MVNLTDDPYPKCIAAWVNHRSEQRWAPPAAAEYATSLKTSRLLLDLSDAAVALAGPLRDDMRELWEEVRGEVAEELARRIGGAK